MGRCQQPGGRHNPVVVDPVFSMRSSGEEQGVHSVADPSRVRFTGPLTPFASGLAGELASLGYAATTATNQLQVAASLSRWLTASGVGLGGLTGPVLDRFLLERRGRGASRCSVRALGPVLGYLRRIGVVPEEPLPSPAVSAVDVLLGRFSCYLAGQRAL